VPGSASRTFRIGTRGSALALVQARWVAASLSELGIGTELILLRTDGDDRAADTSWGEGAFVGRIVEALLDGTVDMGVHSAKDVPTDEHPDTVIAAYPRRDDPRDALVCRERGSTLARLPHGARVGTDSPRRTAFLKALRPDLELHPLHGNVDTRLAKLDRGDTDALVLAVAGLTRLGLADRIDEVFPVELVASAPGQGALAVQVRADDVEARGAAARLDDPATRIAVVAERLLLTAAGGGCRSPIGAVGRVEGDRFWLVAGAERIWVPTRGAATDLARVVWVRTEGEPRHHRALAERLAARIVTLRTRPRVLVTRPARQAAPLLEALSREGVEAVHVPAIEIRHVDGGGPLVVAITAAAAGTWIVLTSVNAMSATLRAVARAGVSPGNLRWAAIGATTAAALRGQGISDPFVPRIPTARHLAEELPIGTGDRVLLPRTDAAEATLPEALRLRGALVEELPAYRTVEAPSASRELLSRAIDDGPIDAIVLTSGSTARGVLGLAAADTTSMLQRTPVIAIGPTTAAVARRVGFDTVIVAPAPDPQSLASFIAVALGVGPVGATPGERS
jgi:hydroxymethylbilane synthase